MRNINFLGGIRKKMNKGVFITFEGIDGSGKTTVINMFMEYLRFRSFRCKKVIEPKNGLIRSILLEEKDIKYDELTRLFLFCAARVENLKNEVLPYLNDGYYVISDRYIDSTIAYQYYGHKIDYNIVKNLVDFSSFGIVPDITFLLDVPACGVVFRKNLDEKNIEFFERVRMGYLEIAKKNSDRFFIIDSFNGNINYVYKKVIEKFEDFLKRDYR